MVTLITRSDKSCALKVFYETDENLFVQTFQWRSFQLRNFIFVIQVPVLLRYNKPFETYQSLKENISAKDARSSIS